MPYADKEQSKEYHRNYMKKRRAESQSQRDYDAASIKRWVQENWPSRLTYLRWYNAERKAAKIKATLNREDYRETIKKIYLECPEGFEVDHIVPLRNKRVCGLHVPCNLQYLSVQDNREKSNKFHE